MKNLLGKLTLLITMCCTALGMTSVHAQNNQQSIPSIWAWEITGKGRTIYLLGELHGFIGPVGLNIDHQLGKAIYQLSSEVWAESRQIASNNTQLPPRLSPRISTATWDMVELAVKMAIDNLSKESQAEKDALHLRFMNELNQNDPATAYASLGVITSLNARVSSLDYLGHLGLNATLRKLEETSLKSKRFELENSTAVAEMWWKHCDTEEYSEIMIGTALEKLNSAYIFKDDLITRTQSVFFKPDSDIDELMNALLSVREGPVIAKCIINPRNHAWLPRLIKALETSGPPISFLVGIGHIGGEEGLLALLKVNGHTNFKRIFSVKQ